MKKKILALCVAVFGAVCANEPADQNRLIANSKEPVHQSMGYFSFGAGPMPIPFPSFGVGYRAQSDHFGTDVSVQLTSIICVNALKANMLFHYYPKPNPSSQLYFGGGVGPSAVFIGCKRAVFSISPEFVFGEQYRNQSGDLRFIQAQVSIPTLSFLRHHQYKVFPFPLVTISYGMGF